MKLDGKVALITGAAERRHGSAERLQPPALALHRGPQEGRIASSSRKFQRHSRKKA
jgi:hypothetical protein